MNRACPFLFVIATVGLGLSLVGCATQREPKTGQSLGKSVDSAPAAPTEAVQVLSLQNIDCATCGQKAIRALEERDGIRAVLFDIDAVEVTVTYDPGRWSPEELRQAVEDSGSTTALGGGKGWFSPAVDYPPDADVTLISARGEMVRIEDHLPLGKVTVVDFFAIWCGPCKDVDRELKTLIEGGTHFAVRKVNVVSWESAISRQYLKKVSQLPYVIVYDKKGKQLDAIAGLDLKRLRAAIQRGTGT